MISIERIDKPQTLNPALAQKSFNKAARPHLHRMQFGKCCYCEKKIELDDNQAEVEHFRPKGKYPELAKEWNNLLLACRTCNGAKLEKFPLDDGRNPLIIDPSDREENPEIHFRYSADPTKYFGRLGKIESAENSLKGKKTIKKICLDREGHNKKRKNYLVDTFIPSIHNFIKAETPEQKNAAKQHLESLLKANSEYAGFARFCARNVYKLDERGIHIP